MSGNQLSVVTPTDNSKKSIRTFVTKSGTGFCQIDLASKHWLILQTLVMATAVGIFKMLINRHTSFKGYVTLTDLGLMYTGLFFITGILFGQVTTDLKEAEKMPSEMAANLEQMEEFFTLLIATTNPVDPTGAHPMDVVLCKLSKLAHHWRISLQENYTDVTQALDVLNSIPELALQYDKKGGSAVVNLFNVVDKTRRIVKRGTALARTTVLPSAHGLVQFFVLASTVMLFFVKYSNEPTQLLVMICVYTVTWFCVRMVSYLDDPFEDEVFLGMKWLLGSNRMVHMFSIDEYFVRLLRRKKLIDEDYTVAHGTELEELFSEDMPQEIKQLWEDENFVSLTYCVFDRRVQAAIAEKTAANPSPPAVAN